MSDELGVSKPDPAFFAAVLDQMGGPEPSSALHVGDRYENDIVPAAAAGMRTAWLRRGPWGVLGRRLAGEPEPDLELASLAELPTRLAELDGRP